MTAPNVLDPASLESVLTTIRKVDRVILGPLHEFYPRLLDRVVGDAETLLDVGCGAQSPAYLATRRIKTSVGLDGFAWSIERSQAAGVHTKYIQGDVLAVADLFKSRTFDAVVCSDVIEHVTKDDGFKLMAAMEGVARKRVIIGTPNGFMPQDGSYEGNRLQKHLSGWRVWDFEDRGYRVYGFGGWKPMKGAYAQPVWQPKPFWHRISMLTEPFLLNRPQWSFQLLAVKEIGP